MGDYIGTIVMVTVLLSLFALVIHSTSSMMKKSRKFWNDAADLQKEAEEASCLEDIYAVGKKLYELNDKGAFGVVHYQEIRIISVILITKKKIFEENEQKNSI